MLYKCQPRLPSPIRGKITSSNICCSRGFPSMCQFSASRFVSVSDLTSRANYAEPAACQVQHIDTSWGKKVNLCGQILASTPAVWLYNRRLGWKGEETRTNCPPTSETEFLCSFYVPHYKSLWVMNPKPLEPLAHGLYEAEWDSRLQSFGAHEGYRSISILQSKTMFRLPHLSCGSLGAVPLWLEAQAVVHRVGGRPTDVWSQFNLLTYNFRTEICTYNYKSSCQSWHQYDLTHL